MDDPARRVPMPDTAERTVEELTQRLAETEAVLQAVISGQVDAIADPLTSAPVLLRDAQLALQRSEERYKDLVSRSPAIVCELTPGGTTTFVNETVSIILGYAPDQLVGKNLWDMLVPPEDRASGDLIQERLKQGEVSNYEISMRSSSGVVKTMAWNSANRYAPDGALEAVVAFGLDVTERKRAEEGAFRLAAERAARTEAEAAERRADLLAGASQALGASLNYDTGLASIARLAVPVLGDWCAVDVLEDSAVPRRVALWHEEAAKRDRALALGPGPVANPGSTFGIMKVIRTGEPQFYPEISDLLDLIPRDELHGEWFRSSRLRSVIIVPIKTRAATIGAITLATAESGRRYSEVDFRTAADLARRASVAIENARLYQEAGAARAEAERARADAESANKAKSEFLASMSHELRTPLNAIGGYTQLLSEYIAGPLNKQQGEYLERIRRSQGHLLGLINDVLNFAKIEAGHVEYDIADVDLRDSLFEVEYLIAPQIGAKGLVFGNAGCDRGVKVRADRDKLRQVLLNLVSNAVKFTAPGAEVAVNCTTSDGQAKVIVSDTGIGIDADKLDAIFEPFVQAGPGLREGTGLGLAISRDLARGMGGDLTVDSVLGEGSAFTVTLPLAEGSAK